MSPVIIGVVTPDSVLFEVYQLRSTQFPDVAEMVASIAGGITSIMLM